MLFAATVLASHAPFLQPGDSTLLFNIFIFIPGVFGIMFASLWLLASDIFETHAQAAVGARIRQDRRQFSRRRHGSADLSPKGSVPWSEPKWLIFIGALMILGGRSLVVQAHRRFPTNIAPKTRTGKKSSVISRRWRIPMRSTLLFIAMTGALAGLLIDVQFYISATSASMGSKGNANFFANFYIMLNFGSLLLQLFAAPKIQDKIGIGGGLMILPFALVGGAGFASAAATAFSLSVLRVTEGGLRSSIHRSIWEQAFMPVDSSERSLVKIAVDGVGARIAEGIAAPVFFWVQRVAPGGNLSGPLDTRWMAWLTLATVMVWLVVTQRLRAQVKQSAPAAGKAERRNRMRAFSRSVPVYDGIGQGRRLNICHQPSPRGRDSRARSGASPKHRSFTVNHHLRSHAGPGLGSSGRYHPLAKNRLHQRR